jgi:hypothetical protein
MRQMNAKWSLAGGIGIGAALMYFLDPERGKHRRSHVRDRCAHTAHATQEHLGRTWRHLSNRARGLEARLASEFGYDPPTDDVLVERVRAKLGHVVRHPHRIEVIADGGLVTLRGPVPRRLLHRVPASIGRVHGVVEVINELEPCLGAERTAVLTARKAQTGA